jgi:triphosphatase
MPAQSPTGQPSDHIEVEWQLDALDLRPVERWLEANVPASGFPPETGGSPGADSGVLSRGPGRTRVLSDSYLDTEDWRLFRAGLSLRVRRRGRDAETTLKSLAPRGDGPLRRRELTEAIDVSGGDAIQGSDGPVGGRIRAVVGPQPLRQALQIRTRRHAIPLLLHDAVVAEVALDRSLIPVGPGQEPIRLRRVEVEVVRDEGRQPVRNLVRDIREACALRDSTGSKLEVALLAAGHTPPELPDMGPTDVDTTSSLGELAFAILRRHFAAMLAHEPGTRLGEDPEQLHDMRVATRRLRAALSMFSHGLPVRAARFREELGWMAGLLGNVRDLDVQLGELDALAPKRRSDLEPVVAVLGHRRELARRAMLGGFDSARYRRLVAGFTVFLLHGPLRRSSLSRAPAVALAPDVAARRYRRMRRKGDGLSRRSSAGAFHRVRIRCKRLRYCLEFFGDLYPDSAPGMVRSLVKVQDLLGAHQDAVVAMDHLGALVDEEGATLPPRTLFAMGTLAERNRRRAKRLRRRFPAVYRGVDAKSWRRLEREMNRLRPPAWVVHTESIRTSPSELREVTTRTSI